jgi:hypothetical protein
MKLIKYFFTLIFIVASTALSQPKLSIDKPEINLGTMYSGMKKKGKIVLKNIGTDTLYISSVQPSCGCTAVKQPKRFLIPNESDDSEFEFNSSGYHGKVEKYIIVTSNDPTSQSVSVKLVADVKEELEPTNHSVFLWFGNVGIGKPSVKEMSLKNISEHSITIKNFTVSSSAITIKLAKKTLKPNDTVDVQVTLKPEKLGYGNDHFTIETDSENQSCIEIRTSYIGVKEN